MAPYIPFVSSPEGLDILKAFYPDAVFVRVALDRIQKLFHQPPKDTHLWIDPAFEGFHHPVAARSDEWKKFIQKFPGHEKFDEPAFVAKPEVKVLDNFVIQILDAALPYKPRRVTIPQFPVGNDNSHGKINRQLAEAASKWRSSKSFSGALIMPLVITNKSQLGLAAEKNKRLDHVKRCMAKAPFDGIWSVDCSLADQQGTQNFEKERFPAIIDLFEALRHAVGPDKHLCAGPYWGLNLVLWARGIVDNPAIGLGNNYQYYVPGSKYMHQSDVRLALTPLRRRAVRSQELLQWLHKTIPELRQNANPQKEFSELAKNFTMLADKKHARRQVAQSYKAWFDSLSVHPAAGRGLALYQDLSSAYVLGKNLAELPKGEGSARRPERVAQQLMLNCL
jgi:hypothetical protein